MKQLIKVVLAACVITSSCTGKNASNGQAGMGDTTLMADTAHTTCRQQILPLPDSSLASADAISYKVELRDSVTPATVDFSTDLYANAPGTMMFRGGMLRDADYGGTVSGTPSEINVDWIFTTDTDSRSTKYGTWGGGTGWTGQPLYVEWPSDAIKRFRADGLIDSSASGREIIVGSLASKIYFIDYDSGKATRKPLDTGNPIKGTVSLDPTLNGNLYVGHGVPAVRPFGALTFNLFKHKLTHTFPEDGRAQRRWNAYDSSPVRVGSFVFRPGENGTIYKWHIADDDATPMLHSAMRYRVRGAAPGIESSMSVYRNYGYVADNHGNVICVNLDTLKPIWLYSMGDDTDGTPTLAVEDNVPYLYVGSEIDRQGEGNATFVKLNALTGKAVWERRIHGKRYDSDEGKHFDGGFYGTPLIGQGNSKDVVMANCVLNLNGQNGELIAFDRHTGKTVWSAPLRSYSWNSPEGFVNEDGHMYVLDGDCAGNLYLLDAADGRLITRKHVGNNFESSAVVKDNTAVIGSRGNTIYKISIR